MMDKLKSMMMEKAKKGKFLDKEAASRKLEVLDELDDIMSGAMAGKLKGLKKVTVASPTEEGLHEGLKKAGQIVSDLPEERSELDPSEKELVEGEFANSEDDESEPSSEELKEGNYKERSPEESRLVADSKESLLAKIAELEKKLSEQKD